MNEISLQCPPAVPFVDAEGRKGSGRGGEREWGWRGMASASNRSEWVEIAALYLRRQYHARPRMREWEKRRKILLI